MPRLIFIQSLIFLFAGFYLYGTEDSRVVLYSITLIGFIFILTFLLPAPGCKFDLHYENAPQLPRYSLLTRPTIHELVLYQYLTLIIIITYLVLIGFPGFQSDAASAKLRVNSNPVLSRFIRVILPVMIVIYASKFRQLPNPKVLGLIFILLLGTGFKGYIISFLLIPSITALYFLNRLSFKMFILTVLCSFLLLYISLWIAVGISPSNFLSYLILRGTVSQSESLMVVFSNIPKYENFPVFFNSFASTLNRFGLNFTSLNEQLFTDLHGSNPYRMQLAIPAIVEFYLKFGLIGVTIFAALFTVFVISLEKRLRKYFAQKKLLKLGICYIIFTVSMDFFSNGNVGSKIIDMVLSSFFYIIVFQTLTLKIFRNEN